MATTGKLMEVYYEKVVETYEKQAQLLPLVNLWTPDSGTMQNAGNTVWKSVEQHSALQKGWDMTGLETDIIEETCPFNLGEPNNDVYKQRADDLRDMTFWERRGEAAGKRQAAELNKDIALSITGAGSLFYETAATSGFDAIAEGQTILNERQTYGMDRFCALNDRDNLKYAKDLASRETIKGRPADTWSQGQIGSNVAGFDIYTLSNLTTIAGGAITESTVVGDQSFAPEGGTVNPATNTVTNVDWRSEVVPVVASAAYVVGDYVSFENAGTAVESIGLHDKSLTGQTMTFKIVSIPDGTSIEVFPKPIALDDPGLSTIEAGYANINTQILTGADVVKLNTLANPKANIIWTKDSIEVTGGDAPFQLLKEYNSGKVIAETMSNGLIMYMMYDGDVMSAEFRCRVFTWYGVTNCNPSANGIFTTS